jgi:hypothetical protein
MTMANTKRSTTKSSNPANQKPVTIAFRRTFLDGEMAGGSVYIKRRAPRRLANKLIAEGGSNFGMDDDGNPVLDLFIHECSPDTDLMVIERDLLARENAVLARMLDRQMTREFGSKGRLRRAA